MHTTNFVSISYSPSRLSAKHCFMSVYWYLQHLEFYRIISRLMPISYARGILGRAVVACPSNAHPQLWCISAPFHHLCLLHFVPWVCINPFRSLHFTTITSRPMSISYSWGIIGNAVVGCPSNAHPQVWRLSAPLHHLCLVNLVPWVCVDPFRS